METLWLRNDSPVNEGLRTVLVWVLFACIIFLSTVIEWHLGKSKLFHWFLVALVVTWTVFLGCQYIASLQDAQGLVKGMAFFLVMTRLILASAVCGVAFPVAAVITALRILKERKNDITLDTG